MNTRQKVLEDALKCVNGEREKQYGNPEDNFKRIASLWSDYINMSFKGFFEAHKIGGIILEPIDVSKMMILFKIARSNGDKDKMDNYVDMIGYAACAAEIFESSEKAEKVLKKKEELGVQLADECKDCDYAEKCIGTGVCLKEEEEKWFNGCGSKKDKPDEKCNRNDCGQFDACMTAYQHYIYNKAKEASETIDKYMRDQKDPYSYFHDKLSNYVSVKAKEEHVPLENLKDVNRKFPRELSDYLHDAVEDCVTNGKKLLDCYKELDEMFAKYVNSSPYRVKKKPDKEIEKSDSFWDTYQSISAHITSSSKKEGVDCFDVVNWLIKNGHAPTEMASLLLVGRLNSDTVAAYIEKAINEVKQEEKDTSVTALKLHPCYCGGEMEIKKVAQNGGMDGTYWDWKLTCKKCGLTITYAADGFYGRKYKTFEEAVDDWNRKMDEGKK